MNNFVETRFFSDMDQYVEAAAREMDVRSIQIHPGYLKIRNQVLHLEGLTLTRFSSNLRLMQFLAIPPGHMTFVLTPASPGECHWCGIEVHANSLAVLHPGLEHQASLPAGWDSVEITVDQKSIEASSLLADTLEKLGKQPQNALFAESPARIHSFRESLLRCFLDAERFPAIYRQQRSGRLLKQRILGELRRILLETAQQTANTSVSRSRRQPALNRALAFIESNLDQPISVHALCERIGTTPRALQLVFQDLCGTTPSGYILSRKLQAVHRDLCTTASLSSPVTETASRFGITHYGRFSAHYRLMFGESPATTLRRRRLG